MPDVANGHADAQLATSRLGADSVKHTGAHHAKFKLAELIAAVTLPPPVGGRHLYQKVRNRASYGFAGLGRSGHSRGWQRASGPRTLRCHAA